MKFTIDTKNKLHKSNTYSFIRSKEVKDSILTGSTFGLRKFMIISGNRRLCGRIWGVEYIRDKTANTSDQIVAIHTTYMQRSFILDEDKCINLIILCYNGIDLSTFHNYKNRCNYLIYNVKNYRHAISIENLNVICRLLNKSWIVKMEELLNNHHINLIYYNYNKDIIKKKRELLRISTITGVRLGGEKFISTDKIYNNYLEFSEREDKSFKLEKPSILYKKYLESEDGDHYFHII